MTFIICIGVISSFTCVTIGSLENQSKTFTPRLYAPEYTDYRYYDENIFYNSGFGMPNCTAYVWGRAYEILGEKPELCTGNACDWFSYNKERNIYSYGTKPKLGAIACFSNDMGGHVAVVEMIENGVITFSNSAYEGSEFYLSTADVSADNPGQDDWEFVGYIYLGDFAVAKNILNCERTVIADSGLNLRLRADTSSEILTAIPKNERVFVTKTQFSDAYLWGQTEYNGVSGYCALEFTQ